MLHIESSCQRKREIRKKMLEMIVSNSQSKSREILRRLINLFSFLDVKIDHLIHSFIPMKGKEPDLWPLFDERDIIVIPKIVGEDMKHFLFCSKIRWDLVKGKYGIFEPRDYLDEADDEELKQIKIILVPLVAFDKSGNRLGRGGGFYDRFLAKMEKLGSNFIKVGVSFHPPVDEELPTEEHDIKLDWCITPYYSHCFS